MEDTNKKYDILSRIQEMIFKENGVVDFLYKESKRLMLSGGINTNTHEDNYLVPKIILTVALERCASEYIPIGIKEKKEVCNLRKF